LSLLIAVAAQVAALTVPALGAFLQIEPLETNGLLVLIGLLAAGWAVAEGVAQWLQRKHHPAH